MATVRNILIDQNADYSEQFTAIEDTGTFTCAHVSATDGTYTIALTDVQTAYGTLERGRYVYDVTTTLDASPNTIQRIQQGVVTVSPSVTRTDP